jgi:hypothetical protein
MEHSAQLLELLRDAPRAFLSHFTRHHEVRRAHLNPPVRTVACCGAAAQQHAKRK